MQLILGCGPTWPKRENDIFVDCRKFDNVDKIHDLNICPWPFDNDSATEIIATHLVEHLHSLLDFMNESWRILKKGGALYIETPEAGANLDLQFADPTHIRCYRKHTFINYFTLSEAHKFGYTDKLWAILHIETKNNNLIVHLTPLK